MRKPHFSRILLYFVHGFLEWRHVTQPVHVGICLIWLDSTKWQMNLPQINVEFDWIHNLWLQQQKTWNIKADTPNIFLQDIMWLVALFFHKVKLTWHCHMKLFNPPSLSCGVILCNKKALQALTCQLFVFSLVTDDLIYRSRFKVFLAAALRVSLGCPDGWPAIALQTAPIWRVMEQIGPFTHQSQILFLTPPLVPFPALFDTVAIERSMCPLRTTIRTYIT